MVENFEDLRLVIDLEMLMEQLKEVAMGTPKAQGKEIGKATRKPVKHLDLRGVGVWVLQKAIYSDVVWDWKKVWTRKD
jgi:hypothetical protein